MPALRGHWYNEGDRTPTLEITRLRSKSGLRETLTNVGSRQKTLVYWGLSWTPVYDFLDCAIAERTTRG